MIKQCIFPIAGLGTRFLPITEIIPKELLPILNTPLLYFSLNEAIKANISEFIFVIRKDKSLIKDYIKKFFQNPDLDYCKVKFIYQKSPKGLGDAILCAKNHITDPHFCVVLPDDIIDCKISYLKTLIELYENAMQDLKCDLNILSVQKIDQKLAHQYGIIKQISQSNIDNNNIVFTNQIIEKPQNCSENECFAIIGRYILSKKIFNILNNLATGVNNEIQLSDAITKNCAINKVILICDVIKDQRFDCGTPTGLYQANKHFLHQKEKSYNCFTYEV